MGAPASLMEREELRDVEPPRVSHSAGDEGVAAVIRPFDVIGYELLDGLDRLG